MTLNPTTIFFMAASGLVVFFFCVAWTANYIDAAEPKPVEPKIDVQRLIEAIKQVENWDGYSIGKNGERGSMQFKEGTWQQFTKLPFWWADSSYITESRAFRKESKEIKAHRETVERLYVSWIISKALPALRLAPTVYNAALVHVAGYGTVEKHAFNTHQTDFANRVTNVYYDQAKTDGK